MEFTSLDEIYTYLESDVFNMRRNWDLTSGMKRLADKLTDESIKEKIKWECFVFDFHLQNGEVKPVHSSVKEDGTTIFAYPSYTDFGDDGLIYLNERTRVVKSDYLSARYNQILWNSPKPHKHFQQAKDGVNAYLKILTKIDCKKEEKKQGRDCLEQLKNGLRLALQAKYKVDEFKEVLNGWLFEKGKFPTDLKVILIKYILDLQHFKKNDFEGCLELINKIGNEYKKKKTDYFFTKDIFETGLKVAQRTQTDTKIWNKRIGDAIVRMADLRMDDDSRMIPLSFLKEALPYYKLAGLDKKVREVEQRYFELKKELKLSKIELPLGDEANDALHEYLETKTAKLMEFNSEEIFSYLISGDDIFPKKQWLIEMGKNRDNTFMDFAVTMRFDINNNVSRQKDTKKAKDKAKIYENYGLYMRLSVLPLLHRVFIEGIKNDKLTYPSLVKFFINHTWLGQEFTDYDTGGDLIKYRWISVIAPSFYEYFQQTESALKSNSPFTNYIMPIDSLTLKFEGVLRDFARILKVSTTVAGKGNVLREKYIEELLAEKEIQKYFDENDLLFFNYLFVAKDGMNLRNNIAHSFFRFNSYNFQLMHLLICAFLRIGKYKMTINK